MVTTLMIPVLFNCHSLDFSIETIFECRKITARFQGWAFHWCLCNVRIPQAVTCHSAVVCTLEASPLLLLRGLGR